MLTNLRSAIQHRRLSRYLVYLAKCNAKRLYRLAWKSRYCIVGSHHVWRRDVVFCIDDTCACSTCVAANDYPGRFEVHRHDAEELAKVLILESWCNESVEDDFMVNEGWGYCGRFGSYLLFQDSQGFVTFEEYDSKEKAEARFLQLYAQGWGASDSDAYISHERGRWLVTFDGKQLDLWSHTWRGLDGRYDDGITERRAIARVRLESMRTGYYPNLWHVSAHGDLSFLTY